jgi:hypothetical protein
MPKILFNPWVKIVNNLRKLDRTTGGYASPINQHNQLKNIARGVKANLFEPFLLQPSTTENTPKTTKNYLMNKSFTHFPQDLLINLKNEN